MAYAVQSGSVSDEDKDICELKLPTCDPPRHRIFEERGSLQKINDMVLISGINISSTVSKKYKECADAIGTYLNGCRMVFASTFLSLLVNVESRKDLPANVLFDVCILACDRPITFLSVISARSEIAVEYNWTVANKLHHAIRHYSDEKVSVAYGVVLKHRLQNENTIKKIVDEAVKESTAFANPLFLTMPKSKLDKVCQAFIATMATQKCVEFETEPVRLSRDLYVLSPQEFNAILNYIDTPRVKVTGSVDQIRRLMTEVAQRLEKTGKTALILRSPDLANALSRMNICSAVLHQEEFSLNTVPRNVRHVVAEVEFWTGITETKTKGNIWIFVTGTVEKQGFTKSGQAKANIFHIEEFAVEPRDISRG